MGAAKDKPLGPVGAKRRHLVKSEEGTQGVTNGFCRRRG